MSMLHIRGVQPSKANRSKKAPRINTPLPPVSILHKNIEKIVATKKKHNLSTPSFGINRIMDQATHTFFMDYCTNTSATSTRIPLNTPECTNFLTKHGVKFYAERSTELSNSKTLISTSLPQSITSRRKKNNTTFVFQIPTDYSCMLIMLMLIRIDFGGSQVEFTSSVGKVFRQFMYRARQAGFKFYYDFIRLNIKDKRFSIVRKGNN